MKVSWTQGLTEQEKLDVLQNFKESLVVRKRLKRLLLDIIEENRTAGRAEAGYDSPNWAFHQADRLGYERAIYRVLNLLEE